MPTRLRKPRPPRQKANRDRQLARRLSPPTRVEVQLIKALRRRFHQVLAIIAFGLRPLLERWPEPPTKTDEDELSGGGEAALEELGDWFERMAAEEAEALRALEVADLPEPDLISPNAITRQIDWLRVILGEWIDEEEYFELFSSNAEALDAHLKGELARVLPVQPRIVPGVGSSIDDWIRQNVERIKTTTFGPSTSSRASILDDIAETVSRHHREGLRVESLKAELFDRFEISQRRAETIARTELSTLNSQITERRQTAVGIDSFKWVTSKDERVRDEHRKLEGKVFKWAVGHPREGHPGRRPNCRCVAIPVLPSFMRDE